MYRNIWRLTNTSHHPQTKAAIFPRSCYHFHYAKCVPLYVQVKGEVRICTAEYNQFTEQNTFVICGTEKFLSNIFSDSTIEKCLMSSPKSPCSMSHGGHHRKHTF